MARGCFLLVLSVDIGGSHINCAVVQDDCIVARAETLREASSFTGALGDVADLLRSCIKRSGVAYESIGGIAIGFCGIVDGTSGTILSTLNKYPDAVSFDLHGWGADEFKLPVRVENDACMALLGEAYAGAARGAKDVVMVTLGTGIGGAAMLGGKLLRSASGQAGCLGGHLIVNFHGRRCVCGAVGCAESEASTAVLPLLCREHAGFLQSSLAGEPVLDFKVLFQHADAGDEVAREIVQHCTKVWSALAVALIHAYGPEQVVFGGGVMRRGPSLLGPIRRYVEEHMWRTSFGVPRIECATLGPNAALLGGLTLFQNDAAGLKEAAVHV